MLQLVGFEASIADINGVRIELAQKGKGRPILFLHPGQGFWGATPALDGLSSLGRVLAPWHPGFGGSELPPSINTVDDLAYFYLDLIDVLDLEDLVIVGASFGGWIAAEIAVRCAHSISQLILVDSLGIKVGGRECRDIADLHAVDEAELSNLLYADPTRFGPKYQTLSDADLIQIARNNEALTLFGWQPYMHNPKLLNRLRRIPVPTLVLWGSEDRVVQEDYGRAFASAIPGARFEAISKAGHLSYVEQPERFNAMIRTFLDKVRH
jgi:pimeloyl-ACP methyl ester carboxylesterase